MYNQDYEEYMRNVLGYTPSYQENTYRDMNYYCGMPNKTCSNEKLDAMYPEIYRKIHPLVMREVGMNTKPYTEDCINEMVSKIYDEVECNIDAEEDTQEVKNRSNVQSANNLKSVKSTEVKEDRQSKQRNNLLRDLIKILLLREILGRPGFPNRPPMPPNRPPFPGGPGMPPPMPRDYYM